MEIIGAFILIYLVGMGIGLYVYTHTEINTSLEGVVWWPITLLKFVLKSLYKVVFTGWRA